MTKKLAPEVFQSLPDTNICDRPESEFPDRARGEPVSRGEKIVEIETRFMKYFLLLLFGILLFVGKKIPF